MMQTAVRYADELWLFLRQEIFTPPPTATAIGGWFWAQLQKGMSFTSLAFLLFFPVCLLLYYAVPKRMQNVWLLLCSYFFYYFATVSGGAAHPQALAVLAGLTLVTYLVALGIDHLQPIRVTVQGDAVVGLVGAHCSHQRIGVGRADFVVDIQAIGCAADGNHFGPEFMEHFGCNMVGRTVGCIDDNF